jgi:hypothetical protein
MKKQNIYGFKVIDENGLGFYRWFNGNPVKIIDNSKKTLSKGVIHLYVAQYYIDFYPAYDYCKDAAQKYQLKFITLTEQDWKAAGHPVKKFFNKLFKRNK